MTSDRFRHDLSEEAVRAIVRAVLGHAESERWSDARREAEPLIEAQAHQPLVADALVYLIASRAFDREHAAEIASIVFEAHADDYRLLGKVGEALECIYDARYLNAAPPSEPVFEAVARRLSQGLEGVDDPDTLIHGLSGLAIAARVLGRTWDAVAERAHRRLVELEPERWERHYDLGLFYKTRGRFGEGQAANRAAWERGGSRDESVQWNLGICATGARDAETALEVWRGMGQHLELGRFGLPEGSYPPVKIRLAERPLAERRPPTEPDDPGAEETVWIERSSPCHGVVRSALYYDAIGVDYGDVILFDGAPITHHTYGDERIAVFPHLVTLVHSRYHVFPFAGTQRTNGQIAELSRSLSNDAVVYVHTEQFLQLCQSCWESPNVDHARHAPTTRHVVTGKLCAPPSMQATTLLAELDRAVHEHEGTNLFVPQLVRTTGDEKRAQIEERRLRMIESA